MRANGNRRGEAAAHSVSYEFSQDAESTRTPADTQADTTQAPSVPLVRRRPKTENTSPMKPPNGGHLRQWEALGMSRATWYRLGKPTTKPEPRQTHKDIAKSLGCSVRTVQRDLAELRENQRQKDVARAREYMAQGYSQDEACRLVGAELRAGAIEKLISEGRLVAFARASQEAATLSQSRDELPAREAAS